MHVDTPGQDTQNNWPVGATGFGLGTFDQPDPDVPAAAGAANAATQAAADAATATTVRSTPARRAAQRFRPAAGTWAPPLALATPAARISNAPAAAATTAARLIRVRIATPHLRLDAGCQPTRVTWISRAAAPATPGELCAEIWYYPPLWGDGGTHATTASRATAGSFAVLWQDL